MPLQMTNNQPSTSAAFDTATFARFFDHTNLKPQGSHRDIEALCNEAADFGFAAVCVAPRWVELARHSLERLNAQSVAVCTVVGFPHGNSTTASKVHDTIGAIRSGASEIDMVISIGDLKDGNADYVAQDIRSVVDAAHDAKAITKTILETAYLTSEEIVLGCQIAARSGADFVKTSTGFATLRDPSAPTGATPDAVALMRAEVGSSVGVKASGGIKTLADADRMISAGANRLGCSSSVEILHEFGKSNRP